MKRSLVLKRFLDESRGNLNLSGVAITDKDLRALAALLKKAETPEEGHSPMDALEKLDLMYNPGFTSAGLRALAGLAILSRLTELNLYGCRVGNATLQLVVELFPTLNNLWIGGKRCSVSISGLEALLGLPDLTDVAVYDRGRYAAKLRELKPGLRVVF